MNRGRMSTVSGALTYVRPTFMLPAVGMSAFGGLLSENVHPILASLHGFSVGVALYVAHLNDGYVDAHVRNEEPPVLPARVNRLAVGAATLLFLVLLSALAATAGLFTVATTVPLWLLAVLHAPYLDTNPVTVTVDYPLGIGVTVASGYITQTNALTGSVLAVALVFVVVLSGIKISIDRLDYAFDQSIGKRTVPVVLGDEAGAVASAAVLVVASVLVMGFIAVGVFPPLAAAATVFLLLAAAMGVVVSKEVAVRLQILLTYPFTVVLFIACCSKLNCVLTDYLTASSFGLAEQLPVF